jgi:hypothetical protein
VQGAGGLGQEAGNRGSGPGAESEPVACSIIAL